MYLVNMSRFAFINEFGLNIPYLVIDEDREVSYEHTLVPFKGFTGEDLRVSPEGKLMLISPCYPVVTETNVLLLLKPKHYRSEDKILFLYSFPVIDGGDFGVFPETESPEAIYKFRSGNPESGYFFDMMFILKKDITYEILYHSEKENQITSFQFRWDSRMDFVSTRFKAIL
jgi:hypothetical protein